MGGTSRCARCQRPMSRHEDQAYAVPSEAGICLEQAPAPKRNPVEELRDVETDRRMEQWRRMLKSSSNSAGQTIVKRRLDPPEGRQRQSPPRKPLPRPQGQATAWLLATLGTMAMIFGVGVLGWALATPMPAWWNWGVGIVLAGQSIMVAALIQLLASLWNQSRHASGRLMAVQEELAELQRTADLLMSSRTSGAASFYADVARQANPQLLLVNLKGQLDELAARLK